MNSHQQKEIASQASRRDMTKVAGKIEESQRVTAFHRRRATKPTTDTPLDTVVKGMIGKPWGADRQQQQQQQRTYNELFYDKGEDKARGNRSVVLGLKRNGTGSHIRGEYI